jgi:hypothetical protein
MRKVTTALLLVSILAAGVAAAPSIYAQTNQEPSGSMMGRGMMGDNNKENEGGMMDMMMQQMSRMMDHCSNMMSGDRPNDQWRNNTPSQPEKKG